MEKSTRQDIAYAVNQCARFVSDPKESHAQAIKQIGRSVVSSVSAGSIFFGIFAVIHLFVLV